MPATIRRAVITGGTGFLGRKLAERLLVGWPDLERLTLADRAGPPDGWQLDDPRVELVIGDLVDRGFVETVVGDDVDLVFHLASVVSAGAEQDFDLGYAVNLHGTIGLLERCRAVTAATGRRPMVIFASSVAAYGSGAGSPVGDATILRPESSYGVQKATGELLINDYHRKGFIDGRGLRLPTVSVRPGQPNLAASGFASGIIREPLDGVDCICPVSPDTVIAVISPRRVVDGFCRIATIDGDRLGVDRILLLPGLAMAVAEAIEAVERAGRGRELGRVTFDVDPDIQRLVDSWPPAIVSERAAALGFVGDDSVAAIVRQHIEDELEPELAVTTTDRTPLRPHAGGRSGPDR